MLVIDMHPTVLHNRCTRKSYLRVANGVALKAVSLGPIPLLFPCVEPLALEAVKLDCRFGVYDDRNEEVKASAERAGVACFPFVLFHKDSAAGVKDGVGKELLPLEA